MEIKKPKWSECLGLSSGSTWSYKPGKPFNSNMPIPVGTEVSAKYGDSEVEMTIIEDKQDGTFLATIRSFGPNNVAPPKDLTEGDCVEIDIGHICWKHNK